MGNDELTATVKQAIETHGAARTARALGLSVEATCRIGGGLPTQAGTRALALANAGRLAAIAEVARAV